jgi:hypothetical protein
MIYNFVTASRTGGTPEKDVVRTETCRMAHDYFTERGAKLVRCLTLPSAWWKFERQLKKLFFKSGSKIRTTFTCVERDWNLFCLASIKIPIRNKPLRQTHDEGLNCQVVTNGSDCNIIHADIFEYMGSDPWKKFNFIWLDTQSPITSFDLKLHTVAGVLDYSKPRMICITVLKARESRKLEQDRVKYITELLSRHIPGIELFRSFEYMDSSPMLHLIFTAENKPKTIGDIIRHHE